ncbi:ATP-binding cassette domain-containing protein [Pediococcus acidilactici]|uniref:ATP-binding cassette domain-containing protein n=1 Tax=Pediococcus acidilactici TaxID=1254 RepID=UPI001869B5B3|nr:ATP-binding cassette domain-containing protein [Pediococcus acidilactici]MCH9266825.1 ATP-binding cassette domain-containing protein [Pediococcus acidilactici]MCK2073711.1 ATP-binding cassette domain-containing protein [Pediococcus acidilactici]MDV2602549.1 ATP-binding cassette domain-containing protein [Pediococcus acidilactici]MDV2843974.1 ATP-binding cassette domain-containing protein [Pediococcus acidilactici]QOP72751.1 ATP-binding cassette domain-containing protein [Pediococcus acidila
MTNYLVETQQLTKSFEGRTVLSKIDLAIPQGKIYGLLGINGAGKSTLMKIITGIIIKYQGKVFYHGHQWERNDLRSIGSLIEEPAAYQNLTAVQNMQIVALEEQLNFSTIERVLNQFGIANTGSRKVEDFSMGMKQRLGIAMAMLKDPELLILDEPFNGLDPYGIKELKNYLRKLARQGKTIMISSHILPELQDFAEYVGIIHDGKLVYQGQVSEEQDISQIFFAETNQKG